MHGDRRPFPVMLVTLDEEEIVPWAREPRASRTARSPRSRSTRRCTRSSRTCSTRPTRSTPQVEQVKRFFILDHDLSQETGELTPTLKVKRNVVNEKYAGRFDELYGGPA